MKRVCSSHAQGEAKPHPDYPPSRQDVAPRYWFEMVAFVPSSLVKLTVNGSA
jgi:hypothetical protein